MAFSIDNKLQWTEHYVEHGFCVIKGVVGRDFIDPALEEIQGSLDHDLPLHQWDINNTPRRHQVATSAYQHLPKIYDQPGIRDIFKTMFAPSHRWNGERHFQVFISPYQEDIDMPVLPGVGHIDFVKCPIPIFGSGFMFQVSLVKTEPFSGNITIYPGTHKKVQRALADNPDLQYRTDPIFEELLRAEPFEYVAEPGDVLLFHHLVGHQGNVNHAAGRSPRVALHCQANCEQWLRELDPADENLSPWERSLTFTGGRYRTRRDEEEWIREFAKTRVTKPAVVY